MVGIGSGNYIYYWKSKGLSDGRINSITASSYKITPQLKKKKVTMVPKQEHNLIEAV